MRSSNRLIEQSYRIYILLLCYELGIYAQSLTVARRRLRERASAEGGPELALLPGLWPPDLPVRRAHHAAPHASSDAADGRRGAHCLLPLEHRLPTRHPRRRQLRSRATLAAQVCLPFHCSKNLLLLGIRLYEYCATTLLVHYDYYSPVLYSIHYTVYCIRVHTEST